MIPSIRTGEDLLEVVRKSQLLPLEGIPTPPAVLLVNMGIQNQSTFTEIKRILEDFRDRIIRFFESGDETQLTSSIHPLLGGYRGALELPLERIREIILGYIDRVLEFIKGNH